MRKVPKPIERSYGVEVLSLCNSDGTGGIEVRNNRPSAT